MEAANEYGTNLSIQGKIKAGIKQKLKEADVQIEKFKQELKLPEQFCGACTLKEGTWVVLLFFQSVSAIFVGYVMSLILTKYEQTEKWWEQRFQSDFDPYINGENRHIIDTLYPLWLPITYGLVGLEASYFGSGLLVMYALCNKTSHPGCYLPWLVFTALLVSLNFLTALSMVAYGFWISIYRPVTVTGDMVPALLTFLYGGMWSYGFVVVLAHYKRRVIVKWWKDYEMRQRKQGL